MKRCAGWAWLRASTVCGVTAVSAVWLLLPSKETTEAAQVIAQLPLQSQPQLQPRALAVLSESAEALTA